MKTNKESSKETGFDPVYNANSKILILGSFPSVKSREISFYYGHKQKRFWPTLCGYFNEPVPQSVESKKDFLQRNGIALWDIATSCEIIGSSDASIKNVEIADLDEIFRCANIQKIFLNGTLAYQLFLRKYAQIGIPYVKLTSTSPANPRFSPQAWKEELNAIFRLY